MNMCNCLEIDKKTLAITIQNGKGVGEKTKIFRSQQSMNLALYSETVTKQNKKKSTYRSIEIATNV